MAVVQVSRIQIRRGRKNTGTGFPQLASGELGWAVDTQELYIGNGAVAEGSPAVGNTKILTEKDLIAQGNLLNQLLHIYKPDEIITGINANNPISRSVQDRLDDRVTVTDFGAFGDDTNDDTTALQRAIDQLFLNPNSKSSIDTVDGIKTRVQLELPPGTFKTTSTLYIPSYASLIGAGADKTFINYTASRIISGTTSNTETTVITTAANTNMIGSTISGTGIPSGTTIVAAVNGVELTLSQAATADGTVNLTVVSSGPAIKFINDSSTLGNPSSLSSTLGITQPRNIELKGLTVFTDTGQQTCLQLDAVKDSIFEDLTIKGSWGSIFNEASKGIAMYAVSDIVTCENNYFNNVNISGFSYGVYAKQDILTNRFNNFYIEDVLKGFAFGNGANGATIGQQYGPRNNTISNIKLTDIQQHGIYIEKGTGNLIDNVELRHVGNNGGDHSSIQYPQIYLGEHLNSVSNLRSDRTTELNTTSYRVAHVTLTLNNNITASQGSYVFQANSEASGYLLEDVVNSNEITLYGIFTYPSGPGFSSLFDTVNNLTIAGDSTPSISNTTVRPTGIGTVTVDSSINYIPEVSGYGTFKIFNPIPIELGERGTFSEAFRLPVNTSPFGDPWRSIFYTIEYRYHSVAFNFVRYGRMNITADIDNGTVQLTDEYDFSGNDTDSLLMNFRARFLDASGNLYTGALGQIPFAIEVQYKNTMSNDSGGNFLYTYTSTF